jgi:hypothetical protein
MVQNIKVQNILSVNQHKNERTFKYRAHFPDEIDIQFMCNQPEDYLFKHVRLHKEVHEDKHNWRRY